MGVTPLRNRVVVGGVEELPVVAKEETEIATKRVEKVVE